MLTMQYPLNHTQDCFATKITALISIQMPSELFVPRVSHGNEHHRLITLCGNSNSSKVGDALVGICLAYYITANINRNGISAPAGEFPRQGL